MSYSHETGSSGLREPVQGPLEKRNTQAGTKRACTHCRKQKIRCNVGDNASYSCSRCRRLNLHCVVPPPVKRAKKRAASQETDPWTATTPTSLNSGSFANKAQGGTLQPLLPKPVPPLGTTGTSSRLTDSELPQNVAQDVVDSGIPPTARSIDGFEVEPKAIQDVFGLYFRHYFPLLPILGNYIQPDVCYSLSPCLFWAIMTVGSRRYTGDPTLFGSVSGKVINFTFSYLPTRPPCIETIQALMIILTWVPATRLSLFECGFPLGGLLFNMALHIGLHNASRPQDYTKRPATRLSEEEIHRRTELWAHCVIFYERFCCLNGHGCTALLGFVGTRDGSRNLTDKLPVTLKFHLRLHTIAARANLALLEQGFGFDSIHVERATKLMLNTFEDQISDLEPEAVHLGVYDHLYLNICRLMIQAIYFYGTPEVVAKTDFLRAYTTACLVIDQVNELDKAHDLAIHSTSYIFRAVSLAVVILLRLLKDPHNEGIDREGYKETFFLGINIIRKMGLDKADAWPTAASIISDLWRSDRTFRNPDGSPDTELRIKSRFAMSLLYDAGMRWREERRIQPSNSQNEDRDNRVLVPSSQETTGEQNTSSQLSSQRDTAPGLSFDDLISFDWGWPMSNEFPLGSYY